MNSFISSFYGVTVAFEGISAGDRIASNCGCVKIFFLIFVACLADGK